MTIESDIAAFLKKNADSKVFDRAHDQNTKHAMVIYAETHVGDEQKAPFFAELVRRWLAGGGRGVTFHASERFADMPHEQVILQNHLWGPTKGTAARLSRPLQAYLPLLDAAAKNPSKYAILCANNPSVKDANDRHRAIFDALRHSAARHNLLHATTMNNRTPGNFLLGAFHAGHLNVDTTSAKQTTAQLLERQQLVMDEPPLPRDVYVIRLFVDVDPAQPDDPTVVVGGEGDTVFPLGAASPAIQLLPIFRAHDAGKSFFAEVGGPPSVFSRICADTCTPPNTGSAFNRVYDAILFLNEPIAAPPTKKNVVHTVVQGDTLSGLSQRYYGDGAHWKEIYEANRQVIGKDPNKISVGQRLVIPNVKAQ